jgi:hypothetical protein
MKVQNPIIGRARGSAGGMTFCKNYDKNVARAKAFEVANPKTAAQTTQRNYFKQLSALVATVTDEQLRTLFGQKPKAMSRRNALSAQLAPANTTADNVKSIDFSKIGAIGNGVKIGVAMYHVASVVNQDYTLEETAETLCIPAGSSANLVMVIFNKTTNNIILANTSLSLADQDFNPTNYGCAVGDEIYFYPSVEIQGQNIQTRGFGSFIIKTRAEEKGRKVNK